MKKKLTSAQQREYNLLKEHKSIYVAGWRRIGIFDRLVEKGLAEKDGSFNWYHIKTR